jgi:hypothetical protein
MKVDLPPLKENRISFLRRVGLPPFEEGRIMKRVALYLLEESRIISLRRE